MVDCLIKDLDNQRKLDNQPQNREIKMNIDINELSQKTIDNFIKFLSNNNIISISEAIKDSKRIQAILKISIKHAVRSLETE